MLTVESHLQIARRGFGIQHITNLAEGERAQLLFRCHPQLLQRLIPVYEHSQHMSGKQQNHGVYPLARYSQQEGLISGCFWLLSPDCVQARDISSH